MITSWRHLWFLDLLLFAFILPTSSWISTSPARFVRHPRQLLKGISNGNDEAMFDLNLLLLDHYDSYTYNLYDQIAQLCHKPPIVLPKDVASSWSELQALLRETHNIRGLDGVILSPGPGKPSVNDLGADIIRCNPTLPILGVCLGHQMMATAYFESDDAVICAPYGPVHGHVHSIHHDNHCPLFQGISSPFPATRYHSLVVDLPPSLSPADGNQLSPPILQTTAFCYDPSSQERIVMGMAHSSNPHYGVQFHPESIGSQPQGYAITRNFLQICKEFQRKQYLSVAQPSTLNLEQAAPVSKPLVSSSSRERQQAFVYKVPNLKHVSPQQVFDSLMANEPYAIWLDGTNHHQPTQCSILACYQAKGSGGHRVEYYGQEHEQHVRGLYLYRPKNDRCNMNGDNSSDHPEVCERYHDLDILSFLKREYSQTNNHLNLVAPVSEENQAGWKKPEIQHLSEADAKQLLPFDFRGGHIGYLGYEVRHDTERRMMMSNTATSSDGVHKNNHKSKSESTIDEIGSTAVPTAAFIFAHQSLVYDPNKMEWYLVGVLDSTHSGEASMIQWFQKTEVALRRLATTRLPFRKAALTRTASGYPTRFTTRRPKATYQRNIAECHEFIRLGESYELCLTNQLTTTVHDRYQRRTCWDLYQILRRRNPAPFSAFLNWNSQHQQRPATATGGHSKPRTRFAICCSSPERFVSVQRGQACQTSCSSDADSTHPTFIVEAKPIKGTCARIQPTNGKTQLTAFELREDARRALDLQCSVKNRAENLMIVDLLRNDLSRVCRIGSVHVPKLMHIESYTTVHQMVSTIRGTLDADKTNVDVLEACFPGGSMTGAPKLRTLELLDQLEESQSRGPYSGCLGYISLNGAMDMNIIIRTAVLTPSANSRAWSISVGAGGAITALSESDDEYDEMLLKAKAVMDSIQEWADHSPITVGASRLDFEQVDAQQLATSARLNATWLER